MRDKTLESTPIEKDLGVMMDRDLKFRKQAAVAIAKASRVMGVVKRSFQKLDVETPDPVQDSGAASP